MLTLEVKVVNYSRDLFDAIEDALEDVGHLLLRETMRKLDEPYPPPSNPYEPPHKRSGTLQGSGSVDRVGAKVQLVFAAPYAGFLEEGTRIMDPRPFVSATLEEQRDNMVSIVVQRALEARRRG